MFTCVPSSDLQGIQPMLDKHDGDLDVSETTIRGTIPSVPPGRPRIRISVSNVQSEPFMAEHLAFYASVNTR